MGKNVTFFGVFNFPKSDLSPRFKLLLSIVSRNPSEVPAASSAAWKAFLFFLLLQKRIRKEEDKVINASSSVPCPVMLGVLSVSSVICNLHIPVSSTHCCELGPDGRTWLPQLPSCFLSLKNQHTSLVSSSFSPSRMVSHFPFCYWKVKGPFLLAQTLHKNNVLREVLQMKASSPSSSPRLFSALRKEACKLPTGTKVHLDFQRNLQAIFRRVSEEWATPLILSPRQCHTEE